MEATRERTARVEEAEAYLHELGLRECRVRLHEGELARIEVPASEIARLISSSHSAPSGIAAVSCQRRNSRPSCSRNSL